jgi:hypothetical protein
VLEDIVHAQSAQAAVSSSSSVRIDASPCTRCCRLHMPWVASREVPYCSLHLQPALGLVHARANLAVEAFQGCGTARSCSFKPPAKQHAAVGASAGLNLQDLHGLPLCSLRTQSSWEASHTRKCTVMMRPHVISSSCSLNGMKDV